MLELKNVQRGRIKECADKFSCKYFEDKKPWSVKCDIAFPSATQNEISGEDAKTLVKNGCIAIGEGANMPTTPEGIEVFQKAKILYAPGKAANAGGVAVSYFEWYQNMHGETWKKQDVFAKLKEKIDAAARAVFAASEEYSVSLREAAYIVALKRLSDAAY